MIRYFRVCKGRALCGFVGLMLVPLIAFADDETTISKTTPSEPTKWSLKLPSVGGVVFRGVASFDKAGIGTGSMLYPAPNLGGFIGALIAHGMINESAKQAQKDKLQADADRVLVPYKTVLENFQYRELLERALKTRPATENVSLIENSGEARPEMIVECLPTFSMTQDQKAFVLDNTITIHLPSTAPESDYRNVVRIISSTHETDNPIAYWTNNDGEKLKVESARMVAESLEIVMRDRLGKATDKGTFRTIRYREGISEKIERAQILHEQCNRMLVRTLRGTLMSVPVSPAVADASAPSRCEKSKTETN